MNSVAIIGIGKPGCGKTGFTQVAQEMLKGMGFVVTRLDDRVLLENQVVEDNEHNGVWIDREGYQDATIGLHSILLDGNKPEGHKKVEVLDGKFLNAAHDEMAAEIYSGDGVYVAEWAIGNNFYPDEGEALEQDGPSLIERLNYFYQEGVKVIVVEIESSFEYRAERNRKRKDGLADETFAMLFQDGGELGSELAEGLPPGAIYIPYENNHQYGQEGDFLDEMRRFCEESIKPLIEGNLSDIERK